MKSSVRTPYANFTWLKGQINFYDLFLFKYMMSPIRELFFIIVIVISLSLVSTDTLLLLLCILYYEWLTVFHTLKVCGLKLLSYSFLKNQKLFDGCGLGDRWL